MKIITVNTNGIRAAAKKGFFDWLPKQRADVICVQETKAQLEQLSDPMFHPKGYHCYYNDAVKKGYSGTALYSKLEPNKVTTRLGLELADTEGRWLQVDYANTTVVSLYMPSGTSGDERQELKYQFMAAIEPIMDELFSSGRDVIICADWNICHKEIDLKNWKSNQKNSGFLPDERAWLTKMYDEHGWVDSFRVINQKAEQYTWWSNRGQARANNVGWRLDYQMVTPGLVPRITGASIYTEQPFSDHAPQIMRYSGELV
ncbi:MAG: exodeoxyribonuclease III [Pseudomonadales bacterium]